MSTESPVIEVSEKLRRTYNVHISLIETIPGYNRRTLRERKEELKKQIATSGQINLAITAFKRDGKYYVNHGHGRIEALKELIAEGNVDVNQMVPVEIIKEPKTDEEKAVLLARQITDNDGENLRPIDSASIIKELRETYSWKDPIIADYLGRTTAWVGQTVRLLDLSENVQDLVASDKISATQASDMVRDYGAGEAENLIKEVVQVAQSKGKKKATNKDLKELLGEETQSPKKSSKSNKTADKSEKTSKKTTATELLVASSEFIDSATVLSKDTITNTITLSIPLDVYEAFCKTIGV